MAAKSNITKGALISYVAIFINIVISFVYTPWMIHKIGTADYGLYSLVIAFVSYFLLDFGLNTSVTRFIAKYRAEGDEEKVAKVIGLTTRVFVLIDALIFVVLFVIYFFLENIFTGLTPEEVETLRGLYIIAGIFSILSFALKPVDGAMMAYEYFVPNKVLDMIHRVGSVVLIAILLWLGGDVYSLILVHCGTAFLASVIKYIIFIRKSKLKIKWGFYDKDLLKALLSFSVWIFLIGLAQRFRLSFVPTVLGIVSNSTEIAIFSLGMTIEGFIWTISSALNGLFLPKVTRMVKGSKDRTAVSELLTRVGRIQYFIILLIYSGFVFFGQAFVHCWVGDEFSNTYCVILLLIFPNLITNTQAIANDTVYAENKVRYTGPMIFGSSILGLVACFLFSRQFGAVGAAACTCAALLLYVVLVNIFYKRKLQLDIKSFFKNCHLRITVAMIISLAAGAAIMVFFPISGWLSLFVAAGIYVAVYAINAYFLAFNGEEKGLVCSFIKK